MYAIWDINHQVYFNGHCSTGVVDARDIEPEYLFEDAEAAEEFIEIEIQDMFDAEVAELN